ncbi:hypothetical protein [Flavobacterium laiguense]|uniref:Toprim domain-containing protein n=1 Tax=Flavobacterium laiguense TaxID=2169409 RepID=A0A2U1JX46_9FLAO|nr:hypothetical protein [Flavobacterium laiguense]PWA09529.1 hypothetical protein DB891_07555 [Flavobacterium laiguense]
MTNQPYNLQLLWDASDNGLKYFHDVFPDSVGKENKNKHFITHKEDTPSTILSNKKSATEIYSIFNFSDKKGLNAIDHVMQERNILFVEACEYLFQKYGLSKTTLQFFKPETTYETTTEPAGIWKIDYADKVANYKNFAPFLTEGDCSEYGFYSVNSYSKTFINSKTQVPTLLTVKATENYPIFGYKNEGFTKMYEPKAPKKDKYLLKHHFLGTKPPRHIYGWERLFDIIGKEDFAEIESILQQIKDTDDAFYKKNLRKRLAELQLDSVIIATGGSDGLNLASLGYDVIWFNSEAEIISSTEMHQLRKIAKVVYYVPDLDTTGVKQALAMGLQHLDIKIVWLPTALKLEKKKDLGDWVCKYKANNLEMVRNMFKQLLSQAMELKFWERNEKGGYTTHNKKLIHFLVLNGFFIHKTTNNNPDSTNDVEETRIVQLKKNVVQMVSPREVRNFVLQFMEEKFIDLKVQNMILKSIYFSPEKLSSLAQIDLNTNTATQKSQVYFFNNKVVSITPKEIVDNEYKEVDNTVWKSNIIKHNFDLQNPYFTIAKDTSGNWKIDILDNSSKYFKVLINTSRMFWQKETNDKHQDINNFNITGDKLSEEENGIQQLQLINKMYCIGYLLHKYKDEANSYFVLGMDKKMGLSIKDSNGGSGKSFQIKGLYQFLKNKLTISGRTILKDDPKFMFDGVTDATDIICWDDLPQNYDYNQIFSIVTEDLTANHKGGKKVYISFEDSPKLCATTNFVPNDITAALKRRLLTYQCSDYYHEKSEEYHETRKIKDSFNGETLFSKDYSEKDKNKDFNFMLQCLQFYLSQDDKIDAPEENLIIRNLQQQVGDVQLHHCNDFFSDATKLNSWFPRQEIQHDYAIEAGKFAKNPTSHKKGLDCYCKMNGWVLESKKMIVKCQETGGRKAVEHYFINTTGEIKTHEAPAEPTAKQLQPEMMFETVETDLPDWL